VIDLPTKFEKAIAYLESKSPLPVERSKEIIDEAQDFAFTLAGIEKVAVLQAVQDELVRVLKGQSGIDSFSQFARNFEQVMESNGYGKVNPWRTKLVYGQNIRTAYAAGRHAEMASEDMLETNPYWQFIHDHPIVPRPHHEAVNGRVYRAKDVIKARWGLPAGFGCRCRWESLSEDDVKTEGLNVSNIPPAIGVRDKLTGRVSYVPAVDMGGVKTPLIDPGFHRVPGINEQYRNEIIEAASQRLAPRLQALTSRR
jgi:hypothetical protein